MGEASLWWGMLFGAIGSGYCVYGHRQRAPLPLLCGIGLIVLPWLLGNAWALLLAGAALVALPWLLRT